MFLSLTTIFDYASPIVYPCLSNIYIPTQYGICFMQPKAKYKKKENKRGYICDVEKSLPVQLFVCTKKMYDDGWQLDIICRMRMVYGVKIQMDTI